MISPSDDQTRRFTDEQTDRRLHEHMSKENDVITEADIANIRTDITADTAEVAAEVSDPKLMKQKLRDDSNPAVDNDSWNVLGS